MHQNDKLIFRMVMTVSVIVFLVVALLNRKVLPVPDKIPNFVYFLPKLNAILNGSCALLLVVSLYFIKQKNIIRHKQVNLITFGLSSIFLVSYIAFHFFVKETSFGGTGIVKGVYYFVLITHITASAVVLPLVLLSFHEGFQMQVEKHRKLVRWTFPIWLYVTITGVVVYCMISPYYVF